MKLITESTFSIFYSFDLYKLCIEKSHLPCIHFLCGYVLDMTCTHKAFSKSVEHNLPVDKVLGPGFRPEPPPPPNLVSKIMSRRAWFLFIDGYISKEVFSITALVFNYQKSGK